MIFPRDPFTHAAKRDTKSFAFAAKSHLSLQLRLLLISQCRTSTVTALSNHFCRLFKASPSRVARHGFVDGARAVAGPSKRSVSTRLTMTSPCANMSHPVLQFRTCNSAQKWFVSRSTRVITSCHFSLAGTLFRPADLLAPSRRQSGCRIHRRATKQSCNSVQRQLPALEHTG